MTRRVVVMMMRIKGLKPHKNGFQLQNQLKNLMV